MSARDIELKTNQPRDNNIDNKFTMVSLLPFDYRKKHKAKWHLVKNTTLLIVIVAVVLYCTQFMGENDDVDGLDSFISSTNVDIDAMDMAFTSSEMSNNSNPFVNFTSCDVKHVPWEYRCDFVQKNTSCQKNRYLKLQYCVFQKRLQPLYYILAVCVLTIASIIMLIFIHLFVRLGGYTFYSICWVTLQRIISLLL